MTAGGRAPGSQQTREQVGPLLAPPPPSRLLVDSRLLYLTAAVISEAKPLETWGAFRSDLPYRLMYLTQLSTTSGMGWPESCNERIKNGIQLPEGKKPKRFFFKGEGITTQNASRYPV